MFFFFKLLLKTFNNFSKDKCNVSTIFCYFKTEKLLNSYHSWKNIAIHQDFEVTTSYFSTFELLTIFEKSKYRDISKLSRNGFRSTIHEKLDDFLFLYSHFRISCFIFFWNIKHRSIIGILSALLAEKLQFYSSFKWLSRVERIRIGSGGNVVRWGGNTIQIMPGTFITRPFFSEWRRRINRSSFAQYISALLSRCHARDVAPPDKGN